MPPNQSARLWTLDEFWVGFVECTDSFYLYFVCILVILKEAVDCLPVHFGLKNSCAITRLTFCNTDFNVIVSTVLDGNVFIVIIIVK